jgi:hypothetical protein
MARIMTFRFAPGLSLFRTSAVIAFLASPVLLQTPALAAGDGPFSGMSGRWSGGGSLRLSDGGSERISCRSSESVGGSGQSLSLSLRCASDSYRLEISASVASSGGSLSGSWTESEHGVSGSVSGHVSGGVIRAQVHGGSFSAGVGIQTSGRSQSVTITPSSGTDVRHVTISLHKG